MNVVPRGEQVLHHLRGGAQRRDAGRIRKRDGSDQARAGSTTAPLRTRQVSRKRRRS
jgi:hypothetical protein